MIKFGFKNGILKARILQLNPLYEKEDINVNYSWGIIQGEL